LEKKEKVRVALITVECKLVCRKGKNTELRAINAGTKEQKGLNQKIILRREKGLCEGQCRQSGQPNPNLKLIAQGITGLKNESRFGS